MGRKPRVLVDGGVYHIISRGHNRCRLFHCSGDYKAYKEILREYKKEFTFSLYNYCFMPNHIHLLIRITNGNELPRLLQSINQGYARYYKNSYGLVGNLFQGRYKGMLIERDEYLLECARYIERNPLRAGMVNDPSSYHWSSCKYYTKGKIDDIITSNFLYETLSSDRDERARLYEQYLLQERPYEKLVDRTLRF